MSTLKQEPAAVEAVHLTRVGRFPGMRALAWDGQFLYCSSKYELFRANLEQPLEDLAWNCIASFRPGICRSISSQNRLSSRVFRDGFHALAVLRSDALVAAVPRAIITLLPGETEFRVTHTITRGTRPLHITAVPGGTVYWGEYFDNPNRDEVHIYGSTDGGRTWSVAYSFPQRAIRHVHNIVHDPWADCLWILTGDYGDECRILRASCDLAQVEAIFKGNQQARAVAMVPVEDALYFSSDTPLERNFIYRFDRCESVSRIAEISSSSIFGCAVRGSIFFSTMVEPSEINADRHVRIFGSRTPKAQSWSPLLAWKKDSWPMKVFQYGNASLPDGRNDSAYLAVSTIAVAADDVATSLYAVS